MTGEKETLKELANTPLEQIDPEYRADFERLREQIKEYIASGAQYLFDSNLLHEIQTYLGGSVKTSPVMKFTVGTSWSRPWSITLWTRSNG